MLVLLCAGVISFLSNRQRHRRALSGTPGHHAARAIVRSGVVAGTASVAPYRLTAKPDAQLGSIDRTKDDRRYDAQARLLGGRYQVGELLGYGGMAEVHRGRDLRLGRDVAIKMLRADLARDATFQMRFRREAQNAAALNHPAIVAVYDTGEERGADRRERCRTSSWSSSTAGRSRRS